MELQKKGTSGGLFAASGFYLLAAAGLWVVAALSGAIVPQGLSREWQTLLTYAFYYGAFLFLPIAAWTARAKGRADGLRLNPISFRATLVTVAAAMLAFSVVYDLTFLWCGVLQKLGLNVISDTYVRPADRGELTRSVLSAALIAPLGEELLFRGVLMSAWEKGGSKRAVAVTSLLFAMLHGSITGLPGELLGGVLIAAIVLWTNSIYGGMIFHGAYNAASVILTYVTSGMPANAAAQQAMQVDLFAAAGGAAIAATIVGLIVRGAMLAAIMRLFWVRGRLHGFKPAPAQSVSVDAGTAVVMLAGAVTTLLLYAADLLSMLGG